MLNTLLRVRDIIPTADKLRAVLIFALMLLGSALEVISVSLVLPFIALFTTEQPEIRWPLVGKVMAILNLQDKSELIIAGSALLFALIVIKAAFTYVANVSIYYLNWMAQHRLAVRLLEGHLHSDYSKARLVNSAEIVNLLRQSVGFVYGGFTMPIMIALSDLLMITGTAMVMFLVEPWATATAALVIGGPALIIHRLLQPRFGALGREREARNTATLKALNEALGSLKEATVFNKRNFFLNRFADHDLRFNEVYIRSMALNQIPRAILEPAAMGAVVVVLAVMLGTGSPVDRGLEVLALFAAATLRMMPAALRVMQSLNQARYAAGGIEVVWKALQSSGPSPTARLSSEEKGSSFSKIQLEGVSFSQNNGVCVLKDVNLTIRRGETIGIVGPSGAGKTTFVDLVMGLLEPSSGQIKADGKEIHEFGALWRSHFGYVTQNTFLADDSIKRNVAFGVPDDQINIDRVLTSLRSAQLYEFLDAIDDYHDRARVGERGSSVSGGQLQRIGIARALYHDADILILDEPTSALNAELELEFRELIRSMRGVKTVLIISHRDRMLEGCDRIIRIQDQAITEITANIAISTAT